LTVAPHLGGYVPGGDTATWYPELWRWVVETRGVRSIIDVGCGDGQALSFFREFGCEVCGIDGVPQDDPAIVEHDYTDGPYRPVRRFDLAWCCEFVEHVDEPHIPNFLATFDAADVVLLTHADPGQQGHHHVNCRTSDYWKGVMAAAGFRFDDQLTAITRAFAQANDSPWNHYARSGLAFHNQSREGS
jgi:SAM-dependent methyltransferase